MDESFAFDPVSYVLSGLQVDPVDLSPNQRAAMVEGMIGALKEGDLLKSMSGFSPLAQFLGPHARNELRGVNGKLHVSRLIGLNNTSLGLPSWYLDREGRLTRETSDYHADPPSHTYLLIEDLAPELKNLEVMGEILNGLHVLVKRTKDNKEAQVRRLTDLQERLDSTRSRLKYPKAAFY